MYYKMYQHTIDIDASEMDELVSRLNKSFDIYKKNHKNFLVKILEDRENNKLTVKVLYLEDNVNQ